MMEKRKGAAFSMSDAAGDIIKVSFPAAENCGGTALIKITRAGDDSSVVCRFDRGKYAEFVAKCYHVLEVM